jgi:hypothetical protein
MRVAASIRFRTWHWVLPSSLAALGAAVLFWFDPSQYTFYPACQFHKVTGWLCPGCGCLRALHQLLHGHIVTAFRYNPMLMMFLPILAWYGARSLRQLGQGRPAASIPVHPRWLWVLLGLGLAFGILRNVPGIPFLTLPN